MLQPGTVLSDRFELIRQLGDGVLGSVWLARDRVLDDPLVVKLLAPRLTSRPEVLALLKQECRLARRLHHPGIVRVHDFHDDGTHAFITMAYVPGRTLSDWRGRPWTECLPILIDLADALSYAHAEGVVHRDLKPANVQVDAAGSAHLMDFGVAGALGSGAGSDTPSGGFPGGSPAGMSPQQLAGDPPHPADDVYGFGALVYELVCGVPPLSPPLDAERIRSEIPAPMRAPVAPPQRLVDLVARMLAKLPDDRPTSMAEVRSQLAGLTADFDNRTVPPDIVAAAAPHASIPVAPPSPAQTAPAAIEERRVGLVGMVTAFMFLLMVGIGVGVFVYLPDWIDLRAAADRGAVQSEAPRSEVPRSEVPQSEVPQSEVPRSEAPPPPSEPTVLSPDPAPPAAASAMAPPSTDGEPQSAAQKAAAEAALSDYVTRRDALLEQGVEIWAAGDFTAATEVADRGDRAWLNRDYLTAREAYEQADTALERVLEIAPEVLNGLLGSGEQALLAQDEATARRDFQLALRIDPVNGTAQRGLKRAEALPEVRRLMQAGQALETRSELSEALAQYRQALLIDSESIAASVAVERVSAVIEDRAFREAMTQGLDALDRGDLGAATKAFERGRDLRPGAPEVQDGLQRVAARRRAARIRALRTKAERLETAGDWSAAAAEYSAMLSIDPGLVIARQGAERNQRKARIAADLDSLLADPRALYSDRAQAKAEALITEVAGLSAAPPRFGEQASQLGARLRLVRTPVPVRIESDSETDVVIYRVGSLGRFAQRQVTLRPGVYTVLGTRRGYRDVRRTLTVDPGQEPAALVLRCEERV